MEQLPRYHIHKPIVPRLRESRMASPILMALLIAAGIQITVQQTCHMKDIQTCALKLTEFADNNPFPFPQNKEELDKQCEILDSLQNCFYNYSRKCVSELGRMVGNLLLSSTSERMKDFCTTGDELNTKYLDNSQCITENVKGITPCINTALAALEVLPKRPWNDRLPSFCCATGQFRSCIKDHYVKACNEDVAMLAETIIQFGLTDIISDACTIIENSVTCPELPPPGTPLDGSYKNNIIATVLSSFIRE